MKKKINSPVVTEEILTLQLGLLKTELKDEIISEVRDMFTESNSKFYTRIDPLLSELENARLDREVTTEKLENHEKRIKKLENTN